MHVVFVQDNGINESLALTDVSACVKAAGHTTALLLEREERDLRQAIARENPDLILITSAILAHRWTLRMVERVRRWFPETPRVLAGSHPTLYPDILGFDGVEMIIVGEAERSLVALVDALAGKTPFEQVPGLHFKRGKSIHRNPLGPLVSDLDALPLPDRDLYFDRYPFTGRFPWKKFTSGRGCVHNCSFCYQPTYRAMTRGHGPYLRRKSPERVVREVNAVAARHRVTNVHFSDDLFVTNAAWVRDFAEIYPRRVGIPFSLNTSAELVTEEAVRLLAGAGCRAIAMGVETSDEKLRRSILAKEVSTDAIRKAARLIRDHGIKLVTFNMVGAPGETPADVLETIRFNAELGTDLPRVSICFPLPGTPIAKEPLAGREGTRPDVYELPDLEDARFDEVFFASAKPHEAELINLFHLFTLGVSHPRLIPLIRRLARLPKGRLYALSSVHRMLEERSVYGLSLREGLDYFWHVGTPDRRTTNFVSLV